MSSNKRLLQVMFDEVLGSTSFDLDSIQKYFHPDYKQYVDDKLLDYDQFVNHVKALKSAISQVAIEFQHIIAEDNAVCTVHTIDGFFISGFQLPIAM